MDEITSPAEDYAETLGVSIEALHKKFSDAQEREEAPSLSVEEVRFLKACLEIACNY